MKSPVITEETGLRIWPTHAMVAYYIHGPAVHVAFDCSPFVPDFSPASLKVSDVFDDGRYRKTIKFRIPEASREVTNRMLSLLMTYIVVVYTDERGVDRVMGSPQWPAYLSFERSGGSINVTVEAWGDSPNKEYVKADP